MYTINVSSCIDAISFPPIVVLFHRLAEVRRPHITSFFSNRTEPYSHPRNSILQLSKPTEFRCVVQTSVNCFLELPLMEQMLLLSRTDVLRRYTRISKSRFSYTIRISDKWKNDTDILPLLQLNLCYYEINGS